MNRKLLGIVIVSVIVLAGGFAYLLLRDRTVADLPFSQQQNEGSQTPPPAAKQQAEIATPGTYKEYSEDALAAATGTKILFFHAPWCPQCRQLESDIKKGSIPEGVIIFKVDYDTNQKLRQKYGVTLQTTLVRVDDQGNEIKKFVAYDDPSLDALVQSML